MLSSQMNNCFANAEAKFPNFLHFVDKNNNNEVCLSICKLGTSATSTLSAFLKK